MIRYDFMKYSSKALITFGAIAAYDVFIDGRSFTDTYTLRDAGVAAVSSVASEITYDVVSNLLPYLNEGSLGGLIAKPLLDGIIYSYLYNTMINPQFQYYRDSYKAFYIGAVGNLLIGYIENPIMSLFGNMYN